MYSAEVERSFTGECWTCAERLRGVVNWVEAVDDPGLCTKPGRIHTGLNSGYQAINLAYMWGAARIILLGYDMQRGPNGESHHHGDHEGGLPNLGTMPEWGRRMVQLGADLRAQGVEVVNATRQTAITCFERQPIDKALSPGKPPLVLHGMSGMGDCLHQRSVVRELMRSHEVWLKTPWPQVYHDMPRLHPLRVGTMLRTQAKNEKRSVYGPSRPPAGTCEIRSSYSPSQVRAAGSVLGAMSAVCGVPVGDFRMAVPQAWRKKAAALFHVERPVLVYRPLVARTEWGGASTRNPDPDAYVALFRAIRERFYVVSVADLVPKVEWTVGPQIEADVEYHAGELDFETLAGLFARAALVFSAPGFATVLAQAVGTPAVTVFGGYEDARSFSAGAKFTKWLPIEPITPCACWSHAHACRKAIDMPRAIDALKEFCDGLGATGHEARDDEDRRAAGEAAAVPA